MTLNPPGSQEDSIQVYVETCEKDKIKNAD